MVHDVGTRMPETVTEMAMKFDAGGYLSVLPVKVEACMAIVDKSGDGGGSMAEGDAAEDKKETEGSTIVLTAIWTTTPLRSADCSSHEPVKKPP